MLNAYLQLIFANDFLTIRFNMCMYLILIKTIFIGTLSRAQLAEQELWVRRVCLVSRANPEPRDPPDLRVRRENPSLLHLQVIKRRINKTFVLLSLKLLILLIDIVKWIQFYLLFLVLSNE